MTWIELHDVHCYHSLKTRNFCIFVSRPFKYLLNNIIYLVGHCWFIKTHLTTNRWPMTKKWHGYLNLNLWMFTKTLANLFLALPSWKNPCKGDFWHPQCFFYQRDINRTKNITNYRLESLVYYLGSLYSWKI